MHINRTIRSSNYAAQENERKIDYIILHYTEVDFDTAVEYLCSEERGVSSHYLIAKNGEIFNLVDDKYIAWHAGKSYWKGQEALNNNSIGIEIENLGNEPFTDIQMKSVMELCHYLKDKYNIPRENIIGHSDIAPNRKLDPGIYFDWKRLSKEGLGIEMHELSRLPSQSFAFPQNDTEAQYDIKQLQEKLSRIGYKIEITGILDKQTSEVIRAFKAHFCPEVIFKSHGIENYNNLDSKYDWDEESKWILDITI